MKENWKLLTDSQLQTIKQGEDNPGDGIGSCEACLQKRVYGTEGGMWPRLVISIWKDVFDPHRSSFKVSCSRKDDPECWWGEWGIPNELAPDVVEMIQAVFGKKTE